MKKGLVYVFTGEGKGKTSAALGVVVRGLSLGWKVCWISFYKGEDWELSEKKMDEVYENLEMHWVGKGFRIESDGRESKVKEIKNTNDETIKTAEIAGGKGVVVDKASEEEHKKAARDGLSLAKKKIESGKYKLVVLDEIVNAVDEGLVKEDQVVEILGEREGVHVVMTGRGVSEKLVEVADLVTECRKVKHPYDKGEVAIRGLDY